jgi:hypothetical protein
MENAARDRRFRLHELRGGEVSHRTPLSPDCCVGRPFPREVYPTRQYCPALIGDEPHQASMGKHFGTRHSGGEAKVPDTRALILRLDSRRGPPQPEHIKDCSHNHVVSSLPAPPLSCRQIGVPLARRCKVPRDSLPRMPTRVHLRDDCSRPGRPCAVDVPRRCCATSFATWQPPSLSEFALDLVCGTDAVSRSCNRDS